MKPDKQFVVFWMIVSVVAGLVTAFGLMIDTQHPPKNIWFALSLGTLTTLAVYAACDGWGRMLLSDSPKPAVTQKRTHSLIEFINPEKHNY
jgi:hypothetical protein